MGGACTCQVQGRHPGLRTAYGNKKMTGLVLSHLQYISTAVAASHRQRDQGKLVSGYSRVGHALSYIEFRPNQNSESTLTDDQHGRWFDRGAGDHYGTILQTMLGLKTSRKLINLA